MIERVAKIVLVADRQFEWQSDNHGAWDRLGVSDLRHTRVWWDRLADVIE
jgi:hypothetical protein